MDFPTFTLDTTLFEEAQGPEVDVTYDLLILGGGPAAMSAAVYAARKMLTIAFITKDFGGQIRETSEVENWLGFQNINAKDLADSFEEHVKSFSIPVGLGPGITEVTKQEDTFRVATDTGTVYAGRTLILATGKRHRPLNVPGEKELVGRGVAYCATCDAPLYKGKKVVIAGGGNSAFTTAMDLMKVEAEVTLVNFLQGWQADEALQKRIKQSSAVRLLDNHQVVRIEGDERVTGVVVKNRETDKEETLAADGIFVEVGLVANSDMVKDLVELNNQGEVIVDCLCQTSVEGLYGAGDVTTVPHKQIVIAAGEGAKAALSAYSYLIDKSLI
ncbi:MAG: FAD-dependent oxidoreductase [Deltaproteobacteria bacterium]|nr:FAD-dependent oxidoreductase [Deltaproteobacteria bacterium]MBW2078855.1 FAD-dependent oxidoreductase [Deltaproteobacteria bacterium]